MKERRVVITGMGVVAPNAVGLADFTKALRNSVSGIRYYQELADLNFRCQIGGKPQLEEQLLEAKLDPLEQKRLRAEGVLYGVLAGLEAWQDADLLNSESPQEPYWDRGCIFGTGLSGINVLRDSILKTDAGKVRKLGTTAVEQTMPSGISAWLGGKLNLGNQVSSNASACSTGTESILLAADRIRSNQAEIMLAGSCDAGGPYVWGGFDAMRVLNSRSNEHPETASRPMDADAAGFVPGSGGAAVVVESLESAQARGATIYAEMLGGHINSGGQLNSGSMTAPNPKGVQRCIEMALSNAGVKGSDIDLVCGHLTATMGDPLEIENWCKALARDGQNFPYVNSLKSLTGHCLSAAGSLEIVAAVTQLKEGFIQANLNCENIHPRISELIDSDSVVRETIEQNIQVVAKSSFGFGDVNSCIILKKFEK